MTSGLLVRVAVAGAVTAIAALALLIGIGGDAGPARWVAFTALVFGQLVRAYANRSLIHSLRGLPANGFLAIACLVGGLVHLAIPYVPPLAEAFRATPLDGLELALVALIEIVPAVVAETVRSASDDLGGLSCTNGDGFTDMVGSMRRLLS